MSLFAISFFFLGKNVLMESGRKGLALGFELTRQYVRSHLQRLEAAVAMKASDIDNT